VASTRQTYILKMMYPSLTSFLLLFSNIYFGELCKATSELKERQEWNLESKTTGGRTREKTHPPT